MNDISKPKRQIVILSVLGILFLFFICKPYLPKLFIWNTTYSMPVGLYLIENDKNYKIDDIVIIEPPKEVKDFMIQRGYLKQDEYLIKKIKGMEGDTYEVQNDLAYVNGKYIGPIYKTDSEHRVLPNFREKQTIGNGYFLAIADNRPNSYDGRYFGLLKLETIKYKVIPLITFR